MRPGLRDKGNKEGKKPLVPYCRLEATNRSSPTHKNRSATKRRTNTLVYQGAGSSQASIKSGISAQTNARLCAKLAPGSVEVESTATGREAHGESRSGFGL